MVEKYVHPERRKLNNFNDVILKILDILYFYKIEKADDVTTKRRLIFLKPIAKKKFPEYSETIEKEISNARELLTKKDREAYDEFLKYVKEKYPEAYKKLEASTRSSLLAYM